jgi:D-3-phosphoglycerate dehydrogenase
MPGIVATCGHLIRHQASFSETLAEAGVDAVFPPLTGQQFTAEEMRRHIAGREIVIAGDDVIDLSVLEAGKSDRLKAVIKWGIGVDAIDLEGARAIGMPVFNTPGAFADEVADVALGYVLMLARRLHDMHNEVRAGRWTKIEGMSLRGLTAGVIGLGSIGQAVAARCRAFGMQVVGFDATPIPPATLVACGARQEPFDAVLGAADFLIVACALTPSSFHLVGAKALGRLRPGARLVNVARGPVVDEPALIEALASGRLAAAALDVFEEEPLSMSSPLRAFENVVFGTHNASNTLQAVQRINALTIDLALDIIAGRPPRIPALIDV